MTIEIRVGIRSAIVNSPQPDFAETGSTNAGVRRLRRLRAVSAAGMALPQRQPPQRRKEFPENQFASNVPSGSGGAGLRFSRSGGRTLSPSRSTRPPPRDYRESTLRSLLLRSGTDIPASRQPGGPGPIPAAL